MFRATGLHDFWVKALVLQLITYGSYATFGWLQFHQLWNLPLILVYIGLGVLTHRQLKVVGRSTAWVALWALQFRFGPALELGNRDLHLSSLIYLLPLVVAGWPPQRSKEQTA